MSIHHGTSLGSLPVDLAAEGEGGSQNDPTMDVVKQITGGLLMVLVVMLYSSPIPVLWTIIKRKSTLGYAFIPYLLLWMNCFSWVIFAIHRGIATMYEPFVVNSYGLFLNTLSLTIFRKYILDPAVRKKFWMQVPVAVLALILLAGLSFISEIHDCSFQNSLQCWWGKICIVVNSALFGGPFAIFCVVWKTKSVEFLPLGPALSGLVASIDCSIYFYCLKDFNGLFPNLCGILLSLAQVVFYIFIRCNYAQIQRRPSGSSLCDFEPEWQDKLAQAFGGSFKYEDPRETVATIVDIVRSRANTLEMVSSRGSLAETTVEETETDLEMHKSNGSWVLDATDPENLRKK